MAGARLQRAPHGLELLRERLEESGAAVAQANTSVTATNTLVSDSHSTGGSGATTQGGGGVCVPTCQGKRSDESVCLRQCSL